MNKSVVGFCVCIFMLIGCGRPSPETVARVFCKKMEAKFLARQSGDMEKVKKIEEEMESYERSIKKRSKGDVEYNQAIRKKINICADELESKYGDGIDR